MLLRVLDGRACVTLIAKKNFPVKTDESWMVTVADNVFDSIYGYTSDLVEYLLPRQSFALEGFIGLWTFARAQSCCTKCFRVCGVIFIRSLFIRGSRLASPYCRRKRCHRNGLQILQTRLI